MTTTTPASGAAIQRYKIGYHSDEWGQRSDTPSGIPDAAGSWVRYADHLAALAAGQATAAPTQEPYSGISPLEARVMLAAAPAQPAAPTAQDGVQEDAARLDWIAVHGTFGVDSFTHTLGGNGKKRLAATRKNIDAARAAQEGKSHE